MYAAQAGFWYLPHTVSALPACNSGETGYAYLVTDSSTATFMATIASGGTNRVLAVCDGTNWTVH